MPLNLKSLFSVGAEKLVGTVGTVLDNLLTNSEEKEAAKLEIQKEINRSIEALGSQAVEMEKAYLADVASARAMQIAALGQQDNFSKRYMYYLASFVVIAATLFGLGFFIVDIPEGNRRMIEMFADVFVFAGAITVINFFFGSSKSSHDKSDTIAATTKKEVEP